MSPDEFHLELARQIQHIGEEHGLPNAVGPDELVYRMWLGPARRMQIGKALRWHRDSLNNLMTGVRIASYRREGRRMVATLEAVPS